MSREAIAGVSQPEPIMPWSDALSVLTPEMNTLHRYWVHANRLRSYFMNALASPEWLELPKVLGMEHHPMASNLAFMTQDPGLFLSYWYGALYVVVEGWIELKLTDQDVDKLLMSPNVQLLRRFRNGVFHYQKRYFDERFTDFTSAQGTVEWVHDLTNAIGAYFRILAGDTWPEISPADRELFREIEPTKEKLAEMALVLQVLINARQSSSDETADLAGGHSE